MNRENNNKDSNYIKRIIKSLILTVIAVFIAIWGVFALFMDIFGDHSAEAQNIYMIISFFVVVIFIIIFCSFTILDRLKND